MTGKTHMLAGACAALALQATGPEVVMAAFGALLPDVDTAQSAAGKYAGLFAKMLPHRGPTHSLVMLLISTFINPWLGLGVLTHIFLDMITAGGVKLLWPWGKRIRFPLAKYVSNSGIVENVLQTAFVVICVWICIKHMDGFFSLDFSWLYDWIKSIFSF
ncbi:MAG: metal-dependent hydrolase [Acutalibacteraceae bacterium]